MSSHSLIKPLQVVTLLEGLSWLTLLGTMGYRHFTGAHDPVSWAGLVHGCLFILFGLLLFLNWLVHKWTFGFAFVIGIWALVPFGFLFAEPLLKKKRAALGH